MSALPPVRVRCAGREYTFAPHQEVTIGRARDADVVCSNQYVSNAHAVLRVDGSSWRLVDNGSKNGVYVDGQRVSRVEVTGDVSAWLGGVGHGEELVMRAVHAPRPSPPPSPPSPPSPPAPPPPSYAVRIGRGLDNDIILPDLLVSRHHAELAPGADGRWVLRDLESHNGTFVEGQRIAAATTVHPGQRVRLGQAVFRFDGAQLRREPADVRRSLEARRLAVLLDDGEVILDDVSFGLGRGEFLSVVGPTGSGKSTLMKALTGIRPPDRGEVLFDGSSFYGNFEELRRALGYVPQEDILHRQLTVARALDYGGRLRFAPDVTRDERRRRIDEVLVELGLDRRRDVAIEKLSGGQRKRTSVALELLTKPSLLFLDEPTSGLDPGFEKSVMRLLRELADSGRTVVVVTHSLQSLFLCDTVLFLARGGVTAFCGRPAEAPAYFGKPDLADVFEDLEEHGPALQQRFREVVGDPAPTATSLDVRTTTPAPAPSRWRSQVWTLTQRQLEILGRDRRNFLFLAIEVIVPAVLILLLTGPGALAPTGDPGAARTLIGAVIVSATAIGAANAVREIVKETPIYLRERAIGLSRSAYLISKMVVVGAVSVIQTVLLVVIAVLRADGPKASLILKPPIVELSATVALGALAAVALGLLVSAVVSSSEKALALIPVIFIVQWLFSGMTLDLEHRPVLKEVSYLASANWTLAGAASSGDLLTLEDLQRANAQPPVPQAAAGAPAKVERGRDARWAYARRNWVVSMAALTALTAAGAVGANRALVRKEPAVDRPPRGAGRRT